MFNETLRTVLKLYRVRSLAVFTRIVDMLLVVIRLCKAIGCFSVTFTDEHLTGAILVSCKRQKNKQNSSSVQVSITDRAFR